MAHKQKEQPLKMNKSKKVIYQMKINTRKAFHMGKNLF